MEPKLWGNGVWFLLIYICVTYENNLEKLKRLLYLNFRSLPCEECRFNALNYMKTNNLLSSESYEYILFKIINLRNKFQLQKNNKNCFINTNNIIFYNNKLTLKSKAYIFSKFYYEFNKDELDKNKKRIINIHKRFLELLNE